MEKGRGVASRWTFWRSPSNLHPVLDPKIVSEYNNNSRRLSFGAKPFLVG